MIEAEPSGSTTAVRRDAAYLAAGLLATAAQVLLLRELMVNVAGDELAVGLGLFAWFVGIARGARKETARAAASPRRSAALRQRAAATTIAQLAVLPALAVVVGRLLRFALVFRAGELPGVTFALLVAFLTLAPAGVLVGRLFARMAAAWAPGEVASAALRRLYAVECLGSMAGGLSVTLLAWAAMTPLAQAAVFGAAGAWLTVPAMVGSRLRPLAAGVACLLLWPVAPTLERWSESLRFRGVAGGLPLLAAAHTPYQQLALGGGEVLHLYGSGQYVTSFPDPYGVESRGHLLALLAPRPRRVLVLGGVEQGLVGVLSKHPVEHLVLVEADRARHAFLEARLSDSERLTLRDPRVRLVFDDPRRFLARSAERFDLIIHLGADPSTLLRARLTTLEFQRTAASRLEPGGVLVVGLPAAPTVLAGETEQLAGALVRTLREIFPVVRATLSNDAFAVAGHDAAAVSLDPAALASRWRERGVRSQSFAPELLPVLLPPDRVAAQEAALDLAARSAPLSLDDRPAALSHALIRRQQLVADPRTGRLIQCALQAPPLLLVVLAALPTLVDLRAVARTTDPAQAVSRLARHAVTVAGAAGLGWSLLLLFSFQTHAGVLYGWLGALVALFMSGLAAGGGLAHRLGSAPRQSPAGALLRWMIVAVAAGLVLPLGLGLGAAAERLGWGAVFGLHALLLFVAGAATGGVFPRSVDALLAAGASPGEAAGRVESADHAGAAVAAVAGAVLFVPGLGLRGSALLIAALLAVPAVVLARMERARGEARLS